jgi:hypothetical protein
MHADTIDTGPYIGFLRAFGPPEVIALDPFAGNAVAVEAASGFWERIEAVSFELVTAAGGAARRARVSYFAGESVPLAIVPAPFTLAASNTQQVTFAVGVEPAGANNDAAILAPLPALWLLPGWSVELGVGAGAAGDTVSAVRVTRQRYRVIELEPLELELAGG